MPAREIFSLWIVGRNGGLLYSKVRGIFMKQTAARWQLSCSPPLAHAVQDFVQLPPIDFNEKLRLASSWFGMCGISAQLSPVPDGSGIQLLQADTFDLHSFHTPTGTTFMMVAEPNTPEAADMLRTM